jgi:predicted enzyme related to lactoylglutathione lyase
MQSEQFIVVIGSKHTERLRDFYDSVVGLSPRFEFTAGAFAANDSSGPCLIIEDHSEVDQQSKEPQRMLLSFLVQDIAAEQSRLLSHGVEFIRAAYEAEGVGWFATFADLDGNYCQLIQLNAS